MLHKPGPPLPQHTAFQLGRSCEERKPERSHLSHLCHGDIGRQIIFGSDLDHILLIFTPVSSQAPTGERFTGVADALNDLGCDQQPGHNVLVTITIMLFSSDQK